MSEALSEQPPQLPEKAAYLDATPRTEDSTNMYLHEIARTPLLTAEQEVELAKAIEAGLMAEHVIHQKGEQLSDDEIAELEWLSEAGQAAKQHMITANLRLVVNLSRKFSYGQRNQGMELLDVVQLGNQGLIRAVEKFDYQKGFKFSTYATWWIRQAVTRGLAEYSRNIRIPVHMVESINKLNRIERQLTSDLGREPNLEELATEMKLSVDKVKDIISFRRVEPISLDTPISDDEETSLGDLAARTPDELSVEAAVINNTFHDDVQRLCDGAGLDEREREVFLARNAYSDHFGYGTVVKLDELGKMFGVTRERIRQIEIKARNKVQAYMKNNPDFAAAFRGRD